MDFKSSWTGFQMFELNVRRQALLNSISQLGLVFPIHENPKTHVPNHQTDMDCNEEIYHRF